MGYHWTNYIIQSFNGKGQEHILKGKPVNEKREIKEAKVHTIPKDWKEMMTS